MIRRTIEISSKARLTVRLRQLIVESDNGKHSVPFEDIGFLILDNPQTTCSQGVLRYCAEENIALIATDEKHMPASLLLPLKAHSTHGKIMRMQASIPERSKYILWQQIVRAKINAQSRIVTKMLNIKNARLNRLAELVQPDDKHNCEAQASRIYFKLIFGENFKRDYKSDKPNNINLLLNYGYSIIRAACARALMGSGLHPAFGIHHHNQYNVFCLADDVMEPLRPLIDWRSVELSRSKVLDGIGRDEKNYLLETLNVPVLMRERKMPLMSALPVYCSNLRKTLETHECSLCIPTIT